MAHLFNAREQRNVGNVKSEGRGGEKGAIVCLSQNQLIVLDINWHYTGAGTGGKKGRGGVAVD